MLYRLMIATCTVCLLTFGLAPGQDVKEQPKDNIVQTQLVVKGGANLNCTATTGTLVLKDEDGKPLANMFFVAYTKNDVKDLSKRPITFTFNGGPGAAAVWLHLGAFGPKKVHLDDEGNSLPPPYRLVDNVYHLLDTTDLVFIDPVGTGFSRPAPGVPNSKFHGVQQDLETVGDFIHLYTTRYKRWPSPKFLAGESYGGTRAAGLTSLLQDRHSMNLNGVILVSPAINFETIEFDEGNDLPYALFLPTYTATAWYHKRLDKSDLAQTLAEAKKFAETEYTTALMKGDKLQGSERKAIAAKVAQFTGLSEKYVLQTNLRIEIERFCQEILRDQRKVVGRLDSRFIGYSKDAAGETPEFDPTLAAHVATFGATVNHYLRHDLNFDTDLSYQLLNLRLYPTWDFGKAKNSYVNVAPMLRQAMTKNHDMKVFVANGYFDLATPFCATDYSIDHLGVEPALAANITTRYYEAGHMMYVRKKSHEQLHKDLMKFYESAIR